LKSSEDLKNVLNGEDIKIEKDVAKDLKKMKKLSEDVQRKSNSQDVGEGENELDKMLGGLMNSGIGDIAKEVAENLDVESMFGNVNENSNPMELMSQLMNPEKMGAIFNNINSVMENKMSSGELSQADLKREAEGMMGKMGENPMFKGMMDQMNESQTPQQEQNKDDTKELSKEEKQRRLREKIKEKRDNR